MSIKIQTIADLHTEFWQEPFMLDPVGDVLVLGGDIGVGTEGMEIVKQAEPDLPVIYVAGNHEYYHHSIPCLRDEFRAVAESCMIHFLDNDEFIFAGTRFLGCTLWSDFLLFGEEQEYEAIRSAKLAMNDYRFISKQPEYVPLDPEDTIDFFHESYLWLEEKLCTPFDGPTVIVTHHAPSLRSLETQAKYSILHAAFCSALDDFIIAYTDDIALWIHGHTHYCTDYHIGRTRIVSNQFGYIHNPVAGYQSGLIVEV